MLYGKKLIGSVIGCVGLAWLGGCASLDEYNHLKAQNRLLRAEKEQLAQGLYDARQTNDSLGTRVDSLEGELADKDAWLADVKRESEQLEELRRKAEAEARSIAANMQLSNLTITGPKLPAALDSALERFANEHPTHVVYDAAAGTIKWKSDLLFALGSDVVKESSKDPLRQFSEIIKSEAAADFEVIVVGHTDSRPIVKPSTKAKHPSNWHLSAHRAISVAAVLRNNDYPLARIGIMGYGEYRPVADNDTEDGASQNRRVEIYLIPAGSIVQSADGWSVDGTHLAFARLTP